jgi:hypothetical protein
MQRLFYVLYQDIPYLSDMECLFDLSDMECLFFKKACVIFKKQTS